MALHGQFQLYKTSSTPSKGALPLCTSRCAGKDISTLQKSTYAGLPEFGVEVYKRVGKNEGVESCPIEFLECRCGTKLSTKESR
jgi:hypothetical protein